VHYVIDYDMCTRSWVDVYCTGKSTYEENKQCDQMSTGKMLRTAYHQVRSIEAE
jgi:hypothetical protein